MIIKQLSVFIEDKAGRLTELTRVLSENDINISALSVADAPDYGIVRMVVGRPELAVRILKEQGYAVSTTDVACIIVPNKPGGLHNALKFLSDNNIDVDYLYAFDAGEAAKVFIRTASINDVIKVLQNHKLELLKSSDIYQI